MHSSTSCKLLRRNFETLRAVHYNRHCYRRCSAVSACDRQIEQMAAEMMASVSHPAASLQEQHEWEQALRASNPASTDLHPLPRQRLQLHDSSLPVTSHPAVGATAAECSAWEDALGGTPATLSNTDDSKAPHQGALYAVVECGSHSTRLLLSTGTSDIARLTRDTHLGAILNHHPGCQDCSPASLQRQQQQQQLPAVASATLAAVQEYKELIDQHKQQLASVTVVATASMRESSEGPAIAAAISEVLQHPVHILSGAEEAQLAFKGATASLSSSSRGGCCPAAGNNSSSKSCLVIDMGGGSTEFAYGVAGALPEQTASILLGCLSVQQLSMLNGPAAGLASEQQLLSAAQSILNARKAQLEHIRQAVSISQQPEQQHNQLQKGVPLVVATGGTVTTLAALHQHLPEYTHEAVHMSVLHKHDIQQLMQQWLHEGSSAVNNWPCWLTTARIGTIAPGCAGLLVLMDWLEVDELVVSDCDLLDGAVADMQQTVLSAAFLESS